MSSVDERVVEMRFENGQFEKGISQTSKSLAEFRSKLNLDGAAKGLEQIGNAAGGIKLDGIAAGVDKISSRFSILGAAGFTVINKLTEGALSFGQKLIGNIVDPIVEGGARRAENIAQAKFMLEGLKVAWEDIEPAISKAVNGTAFGLDEAAKAASSLVASRVPLNKMQSALSGIAGVAAMTNSSYTDTAQIFTTVAGNGRLMASELNRIGARGLNAAAAIAKYLGVTETEVRKMTSEGKINFETFAAAMDSAFGEQATKANDLYSGSLANLRAALARIGQAPAEGRFEKLRLIFNALAPQINVVKAALEPLLNLYKELQIASGNKIANFIKGIDLSQLTDGLPNVADGFRNIMKIASMFGKAISTAWKRAFPSDNAAGTWFVTLTQGFENLTAALIPSERNMNGFSTALNVVFGILGLVWAALKNLWNIMKAFGSVLGSIAGLVWEFIEPWLEMLGVSESATDGVGGFFDMLRNGMNDGVKPIIDFLTNLADKIDAVDGATAGLAFFKKFGDIIGKFIKGPGEKIMEFFKNVTKMFKNAFDGASMAGDNVFSRIKAFFENFALPEISWTPITSFATSLSDAIKIIWNTLKNAWADIAPASEGFMNGIEKVVTWIGKFVSGIDTMDVLAAAQAGGVVAVLIMVWKHLKSVNGLLDSAAGLMGSVGGTFDALKERIANFGAETFMDKVIKLAVAVAILAGALWVLSTIDFDSLVRGGVALVALGAALILFTAVIQKMTLTMTPVQAAAITAVANAMLLFSIALGVLAGAAWLLSQVKTEDLIKGVSAVVVMLAALAGASRLMAKQAGSVIGVSFLLITLAGAVYILIAAVKKFGEIDTDVLVQGGIAVATFLLAMSGAMALMGKFSKGAFSAAVGMGVVVLALWGLYGILKLYAKLDWDDIDSGVYMIAGSLAAMVAALVVLSKAGPGVMTGALAIGVLAGSILVLAGAFYILKDVKADQLLATTAALVLVLVALGVVAQMVDGIDGLSGAAGIAIMVGSLVLLSMAIKNLEDVDSGKLWSIVGAMSVILILVGIIGFIAGKVPQVMLAFVALALVIGTIAAVLFGVSAVIDSFSNLIDSIVEGFIKFGDNAQKFADGLKIVSDAALEIAPNMWELVQAGLGLAGLGFGAGLAAIGIGALGAALVILGAGFAVITLFGPLGILVLEEITARAAELIEYALPIAGVGLALLVLGAGLIAAGAGGIVAGLGMMVFAAGIALMMPALESAIPAFDKLADAATRNADAIGPLLGLGAGLLGFGLGAMIASIGVGMLGFALTGLGTGLMLVTAFGRAGTDNLVYMAEQLAALWTQSLKLGAVATALTGLGAAIGVLGAACLIGGVGLMLFGVGMSVFSAAAPLFTATLGIFADGLLQAAPKIQEALTIIGTAISEQLPPAAAALLLFGIATVFAAPGISGMATAMTEFATAAPMFIMAVTSIAMVTGTLSTEIGTHMEAMATKIQESTTKITSALIILGLSVAASSGSIASSFLQVGTAMANSLALGIQSGMASVQTTLYAGVVLAIVSLALTITGMSGSFVAGGAALGSGLATGLLSTIGLAAGSMMAILMMLSTLTIAHRGMMFVAAVAMMSGLIAGMLSTQGRVRAAGITLAMAFVAGVRSQIGQARTAGMGVGQAFTGGLSSGLSRAAGVGRSGGYSVGLAIANGATAGVYAGTSGLVSAVQSMASQAVAAAKARLDINSPSRVFDEEIGQMMGAGAKRGVVKSTGGVVKAVTNMGSRTIDVMKRMVADLKSTMDLDPNLSPTIRPIMDLSEVQKSASQIGALLSANPIGATVTASNVDAHANLLTQRELDRNDSRNESSGDTYVNLTQNISSPKPISEAEVYRNTRNLMSRAKTAANNKE